MAPHPVRAAVEARDLDVLTACLAEDVVCNSPVACKPFEGRDSVAQVLHVAATTFEDFRDFRDVDEMADGDRVALSFSSARASATRNCRGSTCCTPTTAASTTAWSTSPP